MTPRILAGIVLIVAIFYPAMITCQSRGEASFRGPATSNVRGYISGRSQQYLSQSQPYPEFYQQQSQSQSFSNPALNYNSPPYPDYQKQPALYSQSPFMQQPAYQPAVNIPPPFLPPAPSYSEYYDPPPTPLYANNHPPNPLISRPPPPDYSQTYHPAVPVNPRPSYNKPMPPPAPYNPPASRPQTSPEYYNNVQSQQNSNLDNRFGGEGEEQNNVPVDQFTTRPTRKGTKRPLVTKLPPRFDNRDDAMVKKSLAFDGELSKSMELFALELLYSFNSRLENENFMISPFSVYHLLVLIAEGARGKTLAELTDELKLISLERTRDFQQYLNEVLKRSTADVALKKFAMVVTDQARPVNPEFEARVEKAYAADVFPVNFFDVENTLRSINGAVSNYTEGQITEAVKREDLLKAQLILISGLFFQGKWMNVFNTSFTKAEPFYDTNGNKVGDVNMMFQRGPFAYAGVQDLGCHILELPYAEVPASRNDLSGTGLSMILALPRKGLPIGEAIENINTYGMERLYAELYKSKVEFEDDEVEVHVPRFEITSSLDLKDVLEGMGINDMFDQNQADLSNINNRYFVSSMIHKTKISVDEYGTTAAAVTTSIFANKATPPKFHANKPFLFFVVDKVTKLILFSGQYVTPSLF